MTIVKIDHPAIAFRARITIGDRLRQIFAALDKHRRAARTERQLRALSADQLRDIGISPSDLDSRPVNNVDPAFMANLHSLR